MTQDNNFTLSGNVGRCALNGVSIEVARNSQDDVKLTLIGAKPGYSAPRAQVQIYNAADYALMTDRHDRLEGCARLAKWLDMFFDVDMYDKRVDFSR